MTSRIPFPEPASTTGDAAELFPRYLAYYRETVLAKCRALPDEALRVAQLPSGWTPLGLLNHLAHMEQRWMLWGFRGEAVADPWGDSGGRPDGAWEVPDGIGLTGLEAQLREVAGRTEQVLAEHGLDEVAALGGRFEADPPTLGWICFHVLQEYARHAGHLDAVVELAGGPTGE